MAKKIKTYAEAVEEEILNAGKERERLSKNRTVKKIRKPTKSGDYMQSRDNIDDSYYDDYFEIDLPEVEITKENKDNSKTIDNYEYYKELFRGMDKSELKKILDYKSKDSNTKTLKGIAFNELRRRDDFDNTLSKGITNALFGAATAPAFGAGSVLAGEAINSVLPFENEDYANNTYSTDEATKRSLKDAAIISLMASLPGGKAAKPLLNKASRALSLFYPKKNALSKHFRHATDLSNRGVEKIDDLFGHAIRRERQQFGPNIMDGELVAQGRVGMIDDAVKSGIIKPDKITGASTHGGINFGTGEPLFRQLTPDEARQLKALYGNSSKSIYPEEFITSNSNKHYRPGFAAPNVYGSHGSRPYSHNNGDVMVYKGDMPSRDFIGSAPYDKAADGWFMRNLYNYKPSNLERVYNTAERYSPELMTTEYLLHKYFNE